jgi:CRISPR-associated protein Cas5h
MPRTTVAGLLAAIVGAERDSYYDTFSIESSSVAITPLSALQTTNMAMNGVTTADENLRRPRSQRRGRSRTGLQIEYPDTTANRQQQNYEYLVDPAYRIDVAVEDEMFASMLDEHLERGEYVYTPSLGVSECLATVTYEGITQPSPIDPTTRDQIEVDSAVPNSTDAVIPEGRIETERSPAAMEKVDSGGRKTTAFTSYAFSPESNPITVLANDSVTQPVATVGDRTVMFV